MKKKYVVLLVLVINNLFIDASTKNVTQPRIKNVTFEVIKKMFNQLKDQTFGSRSYRQEDELNDQKDQQFLENTAGGGASSQSKLMQLELKKQKILNHIKTDRINLSQEEERLLSANEQLDKKYIRLSIILDMIFSSYCDSHDCFDLDMYQLITYIIEFFKLGAPGTRFEEGTTIMHIAAYYLDVELFYFISFLFIQFYNQDLFVEFLNKEINGFTVLDFATRSPYVNRYNEYHSFIRYLEDLGALHGILYEQQLHNAKGSVVSLSLIDME